MSTIRSRYSDKLGSLIEQAAANKAALALKNQSQQGAAAA